MGSRPYVYHENNFDKTLVTIFSYVKANPGMLCSLTIVEKSELCETNKQSLETICDIKYISPGKELKRFITSDTATDITGKVFDYTDTPSVTPRIAIVVYVYYIEYWRKYIITYGY